MWWNTFQICEIQQRVKIRKVKFNKFDIISRIWKKKKKLSDNNGPFCNRFLAQMCVSTDGLFNEGATQYIPISVMNQSNVSWGTTAVVRRLPMPDRFRAGFFPSLPFGAHRTNGWKYSICWVKRVGKKVDHPRLYCSLFLFPLWIFTAPFF